jgi:alkylation response protein AidB-like acyl-CoA dehydrogenase
MTHHDHLGQYDTSDEAAFRAEVRAFLEAHASLRPTDSDAAERRDNDWFTRHMTTSREWQRTLYEHGWAGITWPTEYGGRGGSAIQQTIFNEEQARFREDAGALVIGLSMVAPTLIVHGSDQQKEHLDRMLRGDELWCQLYSEPGAGSDLASLATRAELDGDEYVVNGQKVWTTQAQFADWAILIARTDPDVPKHRGITYFLVDMRSPGIEVRPIKQINGVEHFNEVFLDDVRIPKENVVGEINNGWRVSHTTLGNERAMIGGSANAQNADAVIELARSCGRTSDPLIRQRLAQTWIRSELLRYLGIRLRAATSRGEQPGPEASVMKLAYSMHHARTGDLVLELLGTHGMLIDDDAPVRGTWQDYFLNQYQVRIGGGTDEVQRNTIGERVLGLPREPSNDRDVAWSELVRS